MMLVMLFSILNDFSLDSLLNWYFTQKSTSNSCSSAEGRGRWQSTQQEQMFPSTCCCQQRLHRSCKNVSQLFL